MFFSVSVSVFLLPAAATTVTSLDLLQAMGALSAEVRFSPARISTTPVVPFLTVTDPSLEVPLRMYTPAEFIVRSLPFIL